MRPTTQGRWVRFAISLTPVEATLLDAMATKADMPRSVLAASLIRHVLMDDAEAHSPHNPRRSKNG